MAKIAAQQGRLPVGEGEGKGSAGGEGEGEGEGKGSAGGEGEGEGKGSAEGEGKGSAGGEGEGEGGGSGEGPRAPAPIPVPALISARSVQLQENPLDAAVDALVASGEYVSAAHIEKLTKVLAAHRYDVRHFAEDLDQPVDLRDEIRKQFQLLRQVQRQVINSDDVEEIKKVLTISKDIFQNLMKFQDTAFLQERSQAFENAVVETLHETSDEEILKKFRYKLAEKLSKVARGQ